MSHPREEVEQALATYLDLRRRIDAGEATWTDLADLFTDDVVYIDPAWGRLEGNDELRVFLDESMRGLEDWRFPVELTAIEGDHIIIRWIQQFGRRDDGTPYEQPGMSTLVYAGDGKFSYEEDLLNMVHVFEDMKASGWQPSADLVMPPAQPNRNFKR